MTWPGATMPPNNNRLGIDPLLVDPEHGDYRLQSGSPAEGYGCLSFLPAQPRPGHEVDAARARAPIASGDGRNGVRSRGTVQVSGPIGVDTLWSADTIHVVGEVTVDDCVTLRILPGVRVVFQGAYALTVMGRLLAEGTPEERIVFTGGAARDRGGAPRDGRWKGIRFPRTSSLNDSTRIEYSVIEGAMAPAEAPYGGALYFDGFSKARIVNTILRDNSAGYGGAVFCIRQSSPRFVDVLIAGNEAQTTASAVYSIDSYPVFTNCTVSGNIDRNVEASWPTAAFVNFIAKTRTTGCIVWDNPSAYFLPTQMIEPKPLYTTYDDIEGGLPGEGNIALDPRFAGDGPHPYRLRGDSPCRDASTVSADLPGLDLAGSLRITGPSPDIGAYEWLDASGVEEADVIAPTSLACLPNPSGGAISMRFRLSTQATTTVTIHDLTGRRIRRLPCGILDAGAHAVDWDGRDDRGNRAATGAYLVRLVTDSGEIARAKIILAR